MHDSKNDPESGPPGAGEQPMGSPMGEWAEAGDDAWLCAALTELPRAIQQLPAAEQAAVIGYYFDERPIEELAASLHLDPARVRSIIQEALRELRRKVPH